MSARSVVTATAQSGLGGVPWAGAGTAQAEDDDTAETQLGSRQRSSLHNVTAVFSALTVPVSESGGAGCAQGCLRPVRGLGLFQT